MKNIAPRCAFMVLAASVLLAGCGSEDASEELVLTLLPRNPERMGFITVTGTVTTNPPVAKGARVVFGITEGRPVAAATFDEFVEARAPAETETISLRIEGLRAAEAYSFFVGVDSDGDGAIARGDLGGYYDGSTVLPFTDPSSARLIPLRRNESGLDFGIGVIR